VSVRVTLNVFSGRPNPTWLLTDDQERDLNNQLAKITDRTREKPFGVLGRLGFRGFSVSRPATAPTGPLSLYVHDGIIDPGQSEENLRTGNRVLESWLLSTHPGVVPSQIVKYVEDELAGMPFDAVSFTSNRAIVLPCPACVASDAPLYQPTKWNVPAVQPYNNCYNYANNQITNTFAQPGHAHGVTITSLDCIHVNLAAKADGLIDSPNFSGPLAAGLGWYVALVIWPGNDYHWYRQDKGGCWSHKPGQTSARDIDNRGAKITDPATCDRGPYVDFCGYMITKATVVIN
jgi:hypothetical protein